MKTDRLANTTVAAFEMGVEGSDALPRLPLRTATASHPRLQSRAEQQFLLDAFAKLCRKRGRRNDGSAFAHRN